jgi:hypothetical protein
LPSMRRWPWSGRWPTRRGRPGEAYCLWLRCEALAPMGRAADARQSARASHSIASRLGHREWTAAALKGQGAACLADGDLAGAEAAFRACLETARRLPIFSGWAAAGLASTLVRSGDLDAAEGYVDQVFREGTPTTHYEGRLAEVELAVARQDPEGVPGRTGARPRRGRRSPPERRTAALPPGSVRRIRRGRPRRLDSDGDRGERPEGGVNPAGRSDPRLAGRSGTGGEGKPSHGAFGSLVRELAVGVWAFAALACAEETGLLDELSEPRSLGDLAERTAVPLPVVWAVVDVLLALGLVCPDTGESYLARSALADVLGSPARRVLRAELRANLLQSSGLVEDARHGRLAPGWRHADPLILHAQGGRAAFLADVWVERIFPTLEGLMERLEGPEPSFLDVGTGVATLVVGLCRRFPQLRAVGLDPLMDAVDEARANVKAHSLADRVQLREGRVEDLDDRDAFDLVHVPAMFLPPAVLDAGLTQRPSGPATRRLGSRPDGQPARRRPSVCGPAACVHPLGWRAARCRTRTEDAHAGRFPVHRDFFGGHRLAS